MLRISGWKRQSVRKLAKPKNNEISKNTISARKRTNKRNESLSKTENILRAYDRQINQHLMISKRVGQDSLKLELENPGTLPTSLFRQYRRSVIYENPLSDVEIISKTKNLKSTELLNFYENQFQRVFSEAKNEIDFLKTVQAAADKENKHDVSLSITIELMIKNGKLNELENALLAAQETKSLSPELIRRFASRTVTEHLLKNDYDAAVVSKETFNLGDDKVGAAFANYFIKNGMSGNARMLEEEMIQNIRDKKIHPKVADAYSLTTFFAAAEAKDETELMRQVSQMDKKFLDISKLASKYRACVENGISDSITRRLLDIYAEKTNRINLLHDLAAYDTASVAPAMILHLGKNAINRSNEDFNSFYRWASSILVNDGYARNDHAKFSRALDAYFIQEQKSIDLQTFIPSVFYRLSQRTNDEELNLFRKMFEEDLTTLNKLSSNQSENSKFGEMVATMNPETVSQLDKWMTTMSPEYFEKEVTNRNASFPKKLVGDMYNEIVNETEIESEKILSLVEALKMPLQEKPSDALITEISNSFVNFILSESNRSGKLTFSNMAELNLLIRKLIRNENRDSAIQLIESIIQRIEAKNKTFDTNAHLFMEYLTSYPPNVAKMISKNSRISSADVEILKSSFPSNFPNSTEVQRLKNSKISKKTFEVMHFMNFKRAVDNMIEYRMDENWRSTFLEAFGPHLDRINTEQFIESVSNEKIQNMILDCDSTSKLDLFTKEKDIFKLAESQFFVLGEYLKYSNELIEDGQIENLKKVLVHLRKYLFSISRKIEGRTQTPNFRQGMDLRMSHGQNKVQNAFGQSNNTFEDFLFNSDIVKIVDAQICDRLVQKSNIGIAEIQNLMEVIFHPGSIRRLCFYLFSKTDDSNERSKISEWIRNQARTVEIDGEPSTNQKSFSITFNGDKDLKELFCILANLMDNSFGRLYYQTMRQQNSQMVTTGVNLMIGHLIRNDVIAASKINLGLSENEIPETLKTYARTIRDIGSKGKILDSNIRANLPLDKLISSYEVEITGNYQAANQNEADNLRDEMYSDLVVALSSSFGDKETNLFRDIIQPYMMVVVRSKNPENYKKILKKAIDNGYRLTPNDMKFINKAERYIEVKNLLGSYSECLENEKSDFGQKKSVQLFETIFNNQIIGLSKWEQTIFSDFLKNESDWMKRAKVDSGTIRAHFGDGPKRKFGREWVYPMEYYVEHALNLRLDVFEKEMTEVAKVDKTILDNLLRREVADEKKNLILENLLSKRDQS